MNTSAPGSPPPHRFTPRPTPGLRLALLAALFAGTFPGHAAAPDLLAHWLAEAPHFEGNRWRAADAAGFDATLQGPVTLQTDAAPYALLFDGRRNVAVVAPNHATLPLPRQALTAEAWVRVDKAQPWGGLIGALQDNGDFERGWLLGFQDTHFSIALASEKTPRLTYLAAPSSFQPGRWHHVVGTYDGASLKLYVDGQLEASSTQQSGPILYPPTAPFVLGAYQDDNEFYPLAGALYEVRLFTRALLEAEIRTRYVTGRGRFPEPRPPTEPFRLAAGPFAEWADRTTLRLAWETHLPTPTVLEFGPAGGGTRRYEHNTASTQHRVEVPDLAADTRYTYRILGTDTARIAAATRAFTFDSTFNYTLPPVPPRPSPWPEDEHGRQCGETAQRILADTGVQQGYALVLGTRDGRLAGELARRSTLQVVVVEDNADAVARARRALEAAGLYGVRVSVHRAAFTNLPYANFLANLIVSERLLTDGTLPPSAPEIARCLRPAGGALWLGQLAGPESSRVPRAALERWLAAGSLPEAQYSERAGWSAVVRRPALPGARDWTHQYGRADNAACSQDDLVRGPLHVLWWGEPGPRPMPDRGARNPAPVAAHGRLYVQGDRLVFGLDAYNGTVLWTVSIPDLRRTNIPRDCSNMAAADEGLYLALGDHALALDGQTGARTRRFTIPENPGTRPYDWGYVSPVQDLLLGSAVKRGAAYAGDDGEWYDSASPSDVAHVTSDYLFALDRREGTRRWLYRGGVVLNSTLTEGERALFFIESRNPAARARPTGRLDREVFTDQFLVALDLRSGRKLWERPVDFREATRMLYLTLGGGDTLVVTGSSQQKYHLWAFDAGPGGARPADDLDPGRLAGVPLWEQTFPMLRDHHGGAIQHPVVVGDTLYAEQRAFGLRSGAQVRDDLPERRGCGTMAASQHSFFYRHHFQGMWDLETNARTEFLGIRSGCWLGMVPSGGLLLAPETSSGCSCTHAIQTSVAYVPAHLLAPPDPRAAAQP